MEYKDFNDYELINYVRDGNEEASNILKKNIISHRIFA